MLLSHLLPAAGLRPGLLRGDVDVVDVQSDSRRCRAGTCFVAVRGAAEDGHRYIPQALAAGASAVVCQDASAVPSHIPCAVLEDSRSAPGLLAQAILGWPARKLTCIAITGTKGKSTSTYLIRAALEGAGLRVGLLGTISYQIGARSLDAPTTTPGPVELAEMMAEMVKGGCSHLVMEVSSHALDQDRTAGLDFAVAVFANLSGDHIDYHKDKPSYIAAKRKLFESLSPRATAVLNQDDPVSATMADAASGRKLWYGQGEGADLRGVIRHIDYSGTDFDVVCGGRSFAVRTPMVGRHNMYNCLCALGVAAAMGLDLEAATRAVGTVKIVPGRLESVLVDAPYKVFVDYSHTDGALENVLPAIRDVEADRGADGRPRGRVIVVFGCGGDRDRTKRPRMAKVAEELADRLIVTSDNPRTEDPQAIVNEVVAGLSPQGLAKAEVLVDRRAAIARAIEQAQAGDVVLIAGKGHETYQILGKRKVPFDDRVVAGEFIRRKEEGR